jgi:hypothetical protein
LARSRITVCTSGIEKAVSMARVSYRAAAHQLHVEMVVDHPGDHRAAAEVDGVGAAASGVRGVAHFDEPSIGDADLGHDGPLCVHRVDPAVRQQQQPSARARLRPAGHRLHQHGQTGQTRDDEPHPNR